MIVRLALQGHELQVFESKLTAVGFGFFVPFFFVTSGIEFDLAALGSVGAIAKLLMFFALFLIVRGTPALLLYRGVLSTRDRAALAFYSATELPLVVAITTLAIETGHMRASTAAGLVGAAMLSTLVFPFVGLALRRHEEADREPSTSRRTRTGAPLRSEESPSSGRNRRRRPPVARDLLADQLDRLVDGGLGLAGLDRLLEQELRLRLHRFAGGGLDRRGRSSSSCPP